MLFISDLDRTLIYSDKFLKPELNIEIVEIYKNKNISYMPVKSVFLLNEILAKEIFIPSTTRSVEQYNRIFIFHHNPPPYAITSNGGHILIHGIPDKNWNDYIKFKIKNESIPIKDIHAKFNEFANSYWSEPLKEVEHLFSYCIVHPENLPHKQLEHFKYWSTQNGWNTILQGRKLYLIPLCVSKGEAIKEILNRTGKKYILAAGDSLVDLEMAKVADMFLSPLHGEIFCQQEKEKSLLNPIIFTKNKGMMASYEILTKATEMINS